MIFVLDTAILSGVFLYVPSVFQTNTDRLHLFLLWRTPLDRSLCLVPCLVQTPLTGLTALWWMGTMLIAIALYLDGLTQSLHAVCLILTAAFHREREIKTLHQETDVSKQVNLDMYFLSLEFTAEFPLWTSKKVLIGITSTWGFSSPSKNL